MHIEAHSMYQPGDMEAPMQRFEIWPHRSLGKAGSAVLLGAVAIGLAVVALRSPAPVLWPITFGCVLTFAAMALALTSNMRSARMLERIEIGPKVVRVQRLGPASRGGTVEFATYWVRVIVSQDRAVANRVTLVESGRRTSVGEFLSPAERKSLADALTTSLAAARSCRPAPTNDNDRPG